MAARPAAVRHAEIAPDVPWQAEVDAGGADTSAIRLFERSGFTVARYFLEMTASTARPPAVTPVEGGRAAPYEQDREHEVYTVHTAAFSDLWGYQKRDIGSWTALTVRSEAFLPELSRVALAGDEVVGYLLSYVGFAVDQRVVAYCKPI